MKTLKLFTYAAIFGVHLMLANTSRNEAVQMMAGAGMAMSAFWILELNRVK